MTKEVQAGAEAEKAPEGNGILGTPPEASSPPARGESAHDEASQVDEAGVDDASPGTQHGAPAEQEETGRSRRRGVAPGEDSPAPAQAEQEEESPLQTAERERDEYLELAQRARAEFENFKRRTAGDVRSAELRGRGGLARELVPTVDNLERALLAAGIDPTGASPDGEAPSEEVSARKALAEGVALVYRELLSSLQRAGVEVYEPLGERFDPSLHEAIASNPVEGVESGLIVETLEKGYRLGDTILRPARVVVSA